ncbi:hypothetical protein HCN44_006385 [Aphidius gifuensis]|uniref:Lipocalin/cytosolic fatty-acid binding domain-containing protein n=2 Tax=Aphidius gifuensis TaxID=684658 RepID=A0A834XW87_APHGI|nr:hypothetical protein HCN44_006385 [Aphidius gifuensis]
MSEDPNLQPMENFDTSKFLGTWYEISRTPSQYEIEQKCSIIVYNYYENSPMMVALASTDIKTGEYSRLPASYTQKKENVAQWDFRYPANIKDSNGVSSILGTDYVNWAVKALLQPAHNRKSGYDLIIWILSREKTLSDEYYDQAMDVFHKNNIPNADLIKVDQSDCDIS